MSPLPLRPPLLPSLAALALGFGLAAGASAADLRVLTAGAYKPVLLELAPRFEQQTGHRLAVDNDTAGGLQRRVSQGEAFDLLILTAGPLDELARAGRVVANGAGAPQPLARVGIGVAVLKGAPRPAVGTVTEFRQALLNARGIATVDPAAGGTSGIYLWGLFAQWGIADALKAKAFMVPGGLSAARVVSGEAEIAVQQMSELLAVPGVDIVGEIPAAIQRYTVYAGAVGTAAREVQAAQALLEFLASPAGRAPLAAKGMAAPGP